MKIKGIRYIVNILIVLFFIPYVYCTSPFVISSYDEWHEIITFYFYPFVAALLLHQVFPKLNMLECYFITFVICWICFLNAMPISGNQNNKLINLELLSIDIRPDFQCSLSELNSKVFEFPIIIKPLTCTGGGKGVVIIKEEESLINFMKTVVDVEKYMVQNYLEDYSVEIGLLWEKMPWSNSGNVIEIYEKMNVEKEIRSFQDGFVTNRSYLINEELNNIFNDISKKIPNLYACRYDIRLKHIDDLLNGDFKIIEINGPMGFTFFDEISNNASLPNKLIEVFMWYLRRLVIGFGNITLLQGLSPMTLLLNMRQRYYSLINCRDWELFYEE